MKKWVVLITVSLFTNILSQTNVLPQFSELKGMEDQLGNTHLFYRIFTAGYSTMGYYYSNSIYRLNPVSGDDNLFLADGGFADLFDQVNDYDFWMNDYYKYIYAGTHIYIEPSPEVYRYDQISPIFSPLLWGTSRNIELSRQDTNIIIVSIDNGINYRSADWGNSWDSISIGYEILSLSPFNHNIIFASQGLNLLKSTDGGNSFFTVDTGKIYSPNFIYDSNGLHIYALDKRFGNHLVVSNNKGEPGSWVKRFSSTGKISITIDNNNPGEIYLADNKKLYWSSNYGNQFDYYRTFESNISGLYKKTNSHFLYVTTTYRIYEINLLVDSIKIIKSITPASENYNWFPLAVGNLWAYENYYTENGIPYFAGYSWNWIENTFVLPNGLKYFRMIERYTNGDKDTVYLRLDSLTAIIYAYSNANGQDLLYEDLSAELGDSVCYEYNFLWGCPYVQTEQQFQIWGLNTLKKELYPNYSGWVCSHSLVKGIGLYQHGCGDLITFYSNLIGCVISGVTYGDTSAVSIKNEKPPIANEFKLEQNYPNPFNPKTVIGYQLPVSGSVSLKVYDVLGNEVVTLVDEYKPAGEYEVEFNASSGSSFRLVRNLTSGIYFYQLRAGDFVQTKKMIYLK